MSNRAPDKADVLQGTLDLMVLQTVATLGPLHGYAIAARLEQVSSGALKLNMGTLYPGLMRLEQRGLAARRRGASPTPTARHGSTRSRRGTPPAGGREGGVGSHDRPSWARCCRSEG